MFIFKPLISIAALGSILFFAVASDALPAHSRNLSTSSKVPKGKKAPTKTGTCAQRRLPPGSPPKRVASKKGKREEIFDRAGSTTLYHATATAIGPLKLPEDTSGDFAPGHTEYKKPKGFEGFQGGFYLTNNKDNAAEYFCRNKDPKAEHVTIMKYTWDPAALAGRTLDWSSETDTKSAVPLGVNLGERKSKAESHTFEEFCGINNNESFAPKGSNSKLLRTWRDGLLEKIDMVTGPMALKEDKDACLAPDFRQYAAITDAGLRSLTPSGNEILPCSQFRVPTA